jgi:hypothetical protein
MILGIRYRQAYGAVAFDTVVFPFDFEAFMDEIGRSLGYAREPWSAQPPLAAPPPSQFARSVEGNMLFADVSRAILGVWCGSAEVVVREMKRVGEVLAKKFGVDVESSVRYYEAVVEILATSSKNAQQVVYESVGDVPIVRRISDLLGVKSVPFGIRVNSAGGDPRRTQWMSFVLEPLVNSPNTTYYIQSIYRSSRRDEFDRFVGNLEGAVKSILATVEGESSNAIP